MTDHGFHLEQPIVPPGALRAALRAWVARAWAWGRGTR